MRDKNILMMQHQPGPQLARSKRYALHFLDRRLFFDRLFLLLFLLPLLLRAAGERYVLKNGVFFRSFLLREILTRRRRHN